MKSKIPIIITLLLFLTASISLFYNLYFRKVGLSDATSATFLIIAILTFVTLIREMKNN
jgi:peptidoglycan biosynthesis protein MviN/MurJ (putative lipid II flippase)